MQLLGDLQFARAEAIREGQPVTVCVSSTGSQLRCGHATPAWQKGWIIFTNPNNVTDHRCRGPPAPDGERLLRQGDTFRSTNNIYAITFNGNGFANLGVGIHDDHAAQLHATS